jgi:carbamoyltransferase
MEFGPRALGHRSILADPRSPDVQRDINMRVKGRESFRPFAPAVLWEHAAAWFDLDRPFPYMLFTTQVATDRMCDVGDEPQDFVERVQVPRSQVPACTHVDGSARVQTVHRETSPVFHQLLSAFHDLTGCPVLLNTSFNRAGEPIVCTPDDALASARDAGLDLLVIEDQLIELRGSSIGDEASDAARPRVRGRTELTGAA